MTAITRTCVMVALSAVVPVAAPGQSDDIKILIAKQPAKSLTDARWTTKLLKLQEESAVNSAISDGKQAFIVTGGANPDWKPRVRHDSTFTTVNGRKFGVVRVALTMEYSVTQTKSKIVATAVRVMAIDGKDFVSVGCLRGTDRPIPISEGACAVAIRKTFGVRLPPI